MILPEISIVAEAQQKGRTSLCRQQIAITNVRSTLHYDEGESSGSLISSITSTIGSIHTMQRVARSMNGWRIEIQKY